MQLEIAGQKDIPVVEGSHTTSTKVQSFAREGENIEHENKLSALQSLEYRGGGEAKLDKTKGIYKEAAVNDFGNITVRVHYFICSELN
ncbi:hypothetical protein MKW98_028341 [Papaver atlanticum]|uniref:Uncharacterized protein n=1 Tax=Papaver atlanticum TaxID=357466 RepID=A0AAD4SXN4_9MAGN|nr:hypothetical protein MKW98_028341 [Papaver atlanticum]